MQLELSYLRHLELNSLQQLNLLFSSSMFWIKERHKGTSEEIQSIYEKYTTAKEHHLRYLKQRKYS